VQITVTWPEVFVIYAMFPCMFDATNVRTASAREVANSARPAVGNFTLRCEPHREPHRQRGTAPRAADCRGGAAYKCTHALATGQISRERRLLSPHRVPPLGAPQNRVDLHVGTVLQPDACDTDNHMPPPLLPSPNRAQMTRFKPFTTASKGGRASASCDQQASISSTTLGAMPSDPHSAGLWPSTLTL
jgi:hypothetical protein